MATISIAGWLSRDSDLHYSDSGTAILKYSIPENDKDGNPTWYQCADFGKRAEAMASFLKKGTPVAVTGRFTLRKYTKDGKDGISADIVVSEIKVLGGKKSESQEEKTEEPVF